MNTFENVHLKCTPDFQISKYATGQENIQQYAAVTASFIKKLKVEGWSRASYIKWDVDSTPSAISSLNGIYTYTYSSSFTASSVLHGRTTLLHPETRMVQLPATAAIEYVAARCITRTRTKTKTRTKTGTITKIVPGCLYPFPPSSMLIRTV